MPAVTGVLPVDKREVVFPVVGRVGKGKFEILPFVIRGFVQRGGIDFAAEKVEQAALGGEFLIVKNEREAAVETGVGPHAPFNVFEVVVVVAENFGIGCERKK